MSYQRKFCEAVAAELKADEVLNAAGNVTVSIEDEISAADEVERQLGKRGVLALIATTGHARKTGTGKSTAGDIGLEVTVFENPKLNRATNKDAFTLTQAAEAIAETLHWKKFAGFKNRIRYISMQRADADEEDARMIVTFAVLQALNEAEAVKWGIGEKTIWGAVTTKERARGGTAQFEPGRDGKAKFVGVLDPHWAIQLTCTVETAAPEIPDLGEKFEFEGVTYICSGAKSNENGEDGSTVTLSGRTI